MIHQIKSDKKSGASELREIAQKAILEFISKPHSKETFLYFLNQLSETRPSMAPIKVLVNSILTEIKDLRDLNSIDQKVSAQCRHDFKSCTHTLIKNAATILKDKKTILTYSYSSTIFRVLRTFPEFNIIVPESRPNFEGRKLALKLQDAGLRVIFITDAEISRFIRRVEIVLIGADRVTENSVINKVGTKGIALLAKEFQIPCYIVCGLDKFLSKKEFPFKEEAKNPEEIWAKKGIEVVNFYFEEIPLKYFTAIITPQGIILPKDISTYFES